MCVTKSKVTFRLKMLGCPPNHTHFCQICGLPGARIAIYREEPVEGSIDPLPFVESMTRVDVMVLHVRHLPAAFRELPKPFQQHVLAEKWQFHLEARGAIPGPLFPTPEFVPIPESVLVRSWCLVRAWCAKWAKQLDRAWQWFIAAPYEESPMK